ncbi:unnamed protein product [Nippostrongylus brasiliensis]|uniref:Lipoprotein n=1 Tax=Nippostrongylus brasiliensis TaxID=27835 RepID=A0A0N4Y774_NIPBR|nr:unnamed protein product [Nippostrongylus brasiliensis]
MIVEQQKRYANQLTASADLPQTTRKLDGLNKFLDAQYDDRLGLGQLHSARDASVDGSALQKDKKDTIPMKRFKPCYYSPIQCLIKRR